MLVTLLVLCSTLAEAQWWKKYGSNAEAAAVSLSGQMTREEMIKLTNGALWSWEQLDEFTNLPCSSCFVGTAEGIPRLGIPPINMQDATQGFTTSRPAIVATVTSFPSALNVVSAWDPKLTYKWARTISSEFREKGANVLLGPTIDIARVMRGGRTSESLCGEDPNFCYVHAREYTRACKENRMATSSKHWIGNTQEFGRYQQNSVIDERTLFEVHYFPFMGAIEGGLSSVMCAYNAVNYAAACTNAVSNNDHLRGKMGFNGWIVTDWWALKNGAPGAGLAQGVDQVMPGTTLYGAKRFDDSDPGATNELLQQACKHIIRGMIESRAWDRTDVCQPVVDDNCRNKIETVNATSKEHVKIARNVAAAGTILLKNEMSGEPVLPLKPNVKVALVGNACYRKQESDPSKLIWNYPNYYSVGGSGRVLSPYTVTIDHALKLRGVVEVEYRGEPDPVQVVNAQAEAEFQIVDSAEAAMALLLANPQVEVVIACGGVSSGEDGDRKRGLELDQDAFLNGVAAAMKKVLPTVPLITLTMSTGSILTHFRHNTHAMVHMFLGGQETGNAFADVLFGDVNPSGRLPVTFPETNNQGVQLDFSEGDSTYTDRLLVGWRGLHNQPVAFQFGHGLSYTGFEYTCVDTGCVAKDSDGDVIVKVIIKNIGKVAGREVPQLYMSYPAQAGQPPLVLRGYARTDVLEPEEKECIAFKLPPLAFSNWQVGVGWTEVFGIFPIKIGSSSRWFLQETVVDTTDKSSLPTTASVQCRLSDEGGEHELSSAARHMAPLSLLARAFLFFMTAMMNPARS